LFRPKINKDWIQEMNKLKIPLLIFLFFFSSACAQQKIEQWERFESTLQYKYNGNRVYDKNIGKVRLPLKPYIALRITRIAFP
jgi:hypothetical protein